MKKFCVLLISVSALLAVSQRLTAQAPDISARQARPTIQIAGEQHNPSSPTGILPVQYKAAYGFNQIPNQGQGQTIALIDAYDDPNIASDLAFYASYFHLAPCNLTVMQLGTIQGQGWDLEESLDVEQACALAPAANIVLVEAASDSFSDLLDAVAAASSAPYNATVVSMSWGGSEFNGEQDYDSYFCNIVNGAGQPVTFVASTGNGGHGTIYPSTSPCVIAAGGTTLILRTATPLPDPLQLNYGVETALSGSGGGVSCCEPEPSWQVEACAMYNPNGYRCVPDISADSNPSPGVPVYDTYGYGGWVQAGGMSAPDWASFLTLVNSLRVSQGKGTLSQADADLYALYYMTNNYSTYFHEITSGNNGGCGLDCDAGPYYNLVTGIGSYQANNLAPAMAADTN